MRYPYERFLRFLVSRKANVDRTVCKYGLPPVGGYLIALCRADIRKSAPHSVLQHLETDDDQEVILREGFLEWARKEGIEELWLLQREFGGETPAIELDIAFQVFANTNARTVMGLLLLSKASDSEICEFITQKFDVPLDDETLEIYRRIFWDIDQLERDEWDAFIQELKTPEERHYVSLGLGNPSFSDVMRYLDETASFTPDQILNKIMARAHARFESAMEQPDPETAGAIKWADLAIKAITALGNTKKAFGGDEPGELTPSEFNNMFSVKIEKFKHVSLAELQGEVSPHDEPDAVGEA